MKRDDLRLDQYRSTVRPMTAEDGTGYLIEFPDVPLCMSDGATVDEAIANGRDAAKDANVAFRSPGLRQVPGSMASAQCHIASVELGSRSPSKKRRERTPHRLRRGAH
jgi:hypothetical protein